MKHQAKLDIIVLNLPFVKSNISCLIYYYFLN